MTLPSEQPNEARVGTRGKRGLPRSVRTFIRRQKATIRRHYASAIDRERALNELMQRFGVR